MCFFSVKSASDDFFSKVIIWGHSLHSHTHSYIHWGFYRAFSHLGYEVHWVKNQDELVGVDFHNALFITEGQVDRDIPMRQDCYYILHNCSHEKYRELFDKDRCILLQVYTDDCLRYSLEKIDECMYCDVNQKIIFLPWATDLLPYEIDDIKKSLVFNKKAPVVYWIGTIGDGHFGNRLEIEAFKKACYENGVDFKRLVNASMERNINAIKSSYFAPAIQGPYQCEKGYIPCRIFKNISYGQWGITNNKRVYDLFKGKIIYNPDTYQLFYDAQDYIRNAHSDELYNLIDFVKDNHTYINRIETLLNFMKKSLFIEEKI